MWSLDRWRRIMGGIGRKTRDTTPDAEAAPSDTGGGGDGYTAGDRGTRRRYTPTTDDLNLTALRRMHKALYEAGLWPNGVRMIDEQGKLSLRDTLHLLHAQDATLVTQVDLGVDVRAILLYPTRTIMLNGRYYTEDLTDPIEHLSLVGIALSQLSLLMNHPPYAEAIVTPFHFERAVDLPYWPIWRLSVWLAVELLLPSPVVCEAINAAGSYRDAVRQLQASRQLMPEVVERQTAAVIRGVADALSAPRYSQRERDALWFPYNTVEMAHALSSADYASSAMRKVAAALEVYGATQHRLRPAQALAFLGEDLTTSDTVHLRPHIHAPRSPHQQRIS